MLSKAYGFLEENKEQVRAQQFGILRYDEITAFFAQELSKRGARREDITKLFQQLTPAPGLQQFLNALNSAGLAIISGGFLEVSEIHNAAQHFRELHGIRLTYDKKGIVTGRKPFDGTSHGKLSCFESIRKRHNLSYSDLLYIGDSGNDHAIAKVLTEHGGTFLYIQSREDGEHYYKAGEKEILKDLERIATATIHTLEDAIPFVIGKT